jgi:hypothetical protein
MSSKDRLRSVGGGGVLCSAGPPPYFDCPTGSRDGPRRGHVRTILANSSSAGRLGPETA